MCMMISVKGSEAGRELLLLSAAAESSQVKSIIRICSIEHCKQEVHPAMVSPKGKHVSQLPPVFLKAKL